MILSAQSIRKRGIITPFHERTICGGMSYGLSGCGYDIRIKQKITLTAGMFTLASSLEHFTMPDDLVGRVCDKSTLARLGIAVQNTIIEPGWLGYLTLEITNHSKATVFINEGQPIAQIMFEMLDFPTMQPYDGKYQDQENFPVAARLEGDRK